MIAGGTGWADRIFEIDGGTNLSVTFKDLSITGGDVKSTNPSAVAEGGGLLIDGGNVVFSYAEVGGNYAIGANGAAGLPGIVGGSALALNGGSGGNGGDAEGGGIYLASGSLTLISHPQRRPGHRQRRQGGNAYTPTSNRAGAGMSGANGKTQTGSGPFQGAGGHGGNGGDALNHPAMPKPGNGGDGGDGGDASGGGIYVAAGHLSISNSTIDSNSVRGGSGGYAGSGGGVVSNPNNQGALGPGFGGGAGGIGSAGPRGALSYTAHGGLAGTGAGAKGGKGGTGGDGGDGRDGGDGGKGGDGGAANGGAIFLASGSMTVVSTSALLLSAGDQIRFVPKTNVTGIVSLTALPWDGSAGADGATGDPADLSSSAFGTTTLTATVAINRAPTLSGANVTERAIAVNTTSSSISVAAALAQAGYSDPDGTTLSRGIAVTGVASTEGTWQYLLPGGAWQTLPAVSLSAALLLPSTAYLRFVAGNELGTAALTFAAWDETEGTAGQLFNITSTGGATAWSTASSTLSIAVQEAPSWSAASGAGLTPILPVSYSTTNTPTPPGDTIASVFGSFFQDANPSVTVGIAVAGLSGNGVWQYSTTNGASWTNFAATPTRTNALLLSFSDLIRFVPKVSTAAIGSLTTYAWDGSVGTAGSWVDLTQLGTGGPAAFSAATLTATAAVNTAPIVRNSSLTETALAAGATGPAIAVSTLLTEAGYSDPDGNSLPRGIAVAAASSSAGTWQYLLAGWTAWQPLPAVSSASALLLPSTAWLRFVAADQPGSASLTFAGWDETQGSAGQTFNIASTGGPSAFSTASTTVSLAIEQAPSWSAAGGASLTPILPGSYSATRTMNPAGSTVGAIFGNFFVDANPKVAVGIAVAGLTGTASGTWQYFTSGGTSWLDFTTTPSKTSALLLSTDDLLRFVPKTSAAVTATLSVYAWDDSVGTVGTSANLASLGTGGPSAFSATTLTAVAAANNAPTLNQTSLPESAVAPNANTSAISIATLLTQAGYSDPDGATLPHGIAMTGASTPSGTWQYLLAGGTWQALPAVSSASALLLPSTAYVRLAAGSAIGPADLTFQGWDETQGAAGQFVDIAASGGATAFSSASATVSVAIKQSPSWTASSGAYLTALLPGNYSTTPPAGNTVEQIFAGFFQDSNAHVTVAIAVAGFTGNGTWQYSTSGGTSWTTFAATTSKTNALLLSASDWIRFVPRTTGAATLTAYAWDSSAGTAGTSANLALLGTGGASAFSATTLTAACLVNTAPVLTTANVSLAAVNENAAGPAATAASLLTKAGYADPDGRSVPSGIAIVGDSGPATWQWFTGAAWTDLPSVSMASAFLLPSSAFLRLLPTDNLPVNTNSSATLTYLAWDQTLGKADTLFDVASQGGTSPFSTLAAALAVPIDFVKQAPTWRSGASASFDPVLAFSAANPTPNPAGQTVASIFAAAFTDAAPDITVGIAIAAQTTASAGAWQYSSDGSTWTDFPTVSTTNALLLPSNDWIRFVPSKDFIGTVSLTAYAWDGSGDFTTPTADLAHTGVGGSTPFSATTLTATCLVNAAPALS